MDKNLVPFWAVLVYIDALEYGIEAILGLISPLFLAKKSLNAPKLCTVALGKTHSTWGFLRFYFSDHLLLLAAYLESSYQDLKHYGDFFLASSWTFSVL